MQCNPGPADRDQPGGECRRSLGDKEGDVTISVHEMPAADIHSSRFYPPGWEPRHESYACLSVSDNGMGMDATILDRAFDPFFSTKFTGRGLGLAVVLGVLKAHKGAVTVESSPGRGAVFQVFLPLWTDEPLPPKREPVGALPCEKRGMVLLVDDEPTLRHMVEVMLRRLGHTVITASNGSEALDKFREHGSGIRCVLLDVSMPAWTDGKPWPR